MRAHTQVQYSDTDRPKGAAIGGSRGRGNVSVWTMVQLTAPNPSGRDQPGQLSVGHLSPHRVSSQKPPAPERTIACRQEAQSPFPAPCPRTLSLLLISEVHGRGFWAQVVFPLLLPRHCSGSPWCLGRSCSWRLHQVLWV